MFKENILPIIKEYIVDLLNKEPLLKEIINYLKLVNAKAYLVGGATRDLFFNVESQNFSKHDYIIKEIKDIDIEVHGLDLDQLAKILSKFGYVDYVGKSFGVLKLYSLNIDWSLPRVDQAGRKPQVSIDPNLNIKEALRRRDLTINAIAIDLMSLDIIDPFNGIKDIENKLLRSPDINFFEQDPLRFYRVMQFISRFEMFPDLELNKICKVMDISKVSKERIEQEFNKLLLQSKRPSLGFRWLESIGRLFEILPELYNTINVKQDPLWHPEGTVFEHLMQSLDSSALLKYSSDQEKLVVMLSALCHDLGKVNTTIWQNGHIRSPGHALAGVYLSKSLLSRITDNKKLIKTVSVLVKCHMRPGQLINSVAKLNAYKRLALDLNNESKGNANIDMLLKLAIADQQGRNPNSHQPLNDRVKWIDKFKEKVKEANIFYEPEKSILKGSDILDLINPGPEMGKILKFAYDIQLNKNIKDKDLLKKIIIEEFNLKSKS